MYSSGNSIASAVFAAKAHLGVCLSFHRPQVVASTVAAYREQAAQAGWEPAPEQIVYRGFGLVADTEERAAELEAVFLPPPLRFLLDGPAPPPGTPVGNPSDGALDGPAPFGMGRMLFAGTPDTVVERIRAFHELTGVGVIDLVFSAGQIPADDVRRSIELFGREVLPRIHAFGENIATKTGLERLASVKE
jgi:alkanesulfonate monooxygenase SsuD/methylene tetrahydromethanopterin reductase-like flavin-dependent oxidoreductase (luciferase family)